MNFRLRRIALACLVTLGAIVVMVPGGGAANRTAEVSFEAVPGAFLDPVTEENRLPAVTYGENIAYRAEFTNTSGSMFTHVTFRMRVPFVGDEDGAPEAESPSLRPLESNCPENNGRGVTVELSNGGHEWQCDLGNVVAGTAGTPQEILTMVWPAPTLTQPGDCEACLKTIGRFTTKEGTNDQTDPNDAFLPPTQPIATLLAASSDTLDSTNTTSAGSYEVDPCTNALGAGSLRTNRALDPLDNPVSTTVCIQEIPDDETNINFGLATTLVEGPSQLGNPGHAALGRSDVCVAQLGENCGPFNTYPPQEFGTEQPLIVVFRIAEAALENGDKVTDVWHNGVLLESCVDDPLDEDNQDGCVVSFEPGKGKVKITTIVVASGTNGFYNW